MSGPTVIDHLLPQTAGLIREGLRLQWQPGMQVYVSIAGETLVDAALGEARPGSPLTPDTIVPWLSSGKPLTAVAVLLLADEREVSLIDPITRFIPEFGREGKADVTIEQLLTHTAGIQPIPLGWPRTGWSEILERIYSAKLRHGWTAGEQAAYDPLRAWFVLGELLQRVHGRPYADVMRDVIGRPLELSDDWHLSAAEREPDGPQWSPMHQCDEHGCRPVPEAAAIPSAPSPGSSLCGPARALGRFYEALLAAVTERPSPFPASDLLASMVRPQRTGMFDLTFQHIVDFGLGVIVDSNRYGVETVPYGFGRYCSPQTFGHGGSQSSIAFADPRHDLVVVLIATGQPGEEIHQRRNRELCSAVYSDLGLN